MNKNYLYIGTAIVILIILYLVYQNMQNKKALAAAQAAATVQANSGQQNWLSQILNSQALSALVGGLAAGYSSSGTKG